MECKIASNLNLKQKIDRAYLAFSNFQSGGDKFVDTEV